MFNNNFVFATGIGATVRDFCEETFSTLGLDYLEFVETKEHYYRPTEVDALIGDASKAEQILDWKAQTYWREIAKIMVTSDLEKLSGELHQT